MRFVAYVLRRKGGFIDLAHRSSRGDDVAMNHFAYVTDDNYAIPTMASINSVVRNIRGGETLVHVVSVGLSPRNAEAIASLGSGNVRVEIVGVDNVYTKYRGLHPYISEVAFFKFRLCEIFDTVDRMLYLDGDTLVYPEAIGVFDADISDVYAGVVADMPAMYQRQEHKAFGLARYFNSGVMYLNLEKMRADGIASELDKRNEASPGIGLDQDVLNCVFHEKVKWLGLRYNCFANYKDRFSLEEIMSFFGASEDELRHPAILHIPGAIKPWNDWSGDVFVEWARYAPPDVIARMARDKAEALSRRIADLESQHEGLARAHAALDAAHAELNARVVDQGRRLAALENNFFVSNALRFCRALH